VTGAAGCKPHNHLQPFHSGPTFGPPKLQPTEMLPEAARDRPTRVVLKEMLFNMRDKSV